MIIGIHYHYINRMFCILYNYIRYIEMRHYVSLGQFLNTHVPMQFYSFQKIYTLNYTIRIPVLKTRNHMQVLFSGSFCDFQTNIA